MGDDFCQSSGFAQEQPLGPATSFSQREHMLMSIVNMMKWVFSTEEKTT
jgi:hypothetical protein